MAIVEARRSRGERVSDVRIASRKPPVSAIWFDLDGRLWVELTAPASSAERWAHVYSPDGSFLYDARWPREIVFAPWGAIRGDLAWGVRRDALRAEQVVRVRFE